MQWTNRLAVAGVIAAASLAALAGPAGAAAWTLTPLGASAAAINARGDVTGCAIQPAGSNQQAPYLYTAASGVQTLSTFELRSEQGGCGMAITNADQIMGHYLDSEFADQTFVSTGGPDGGTLAELADPIYNDTTPVAMNGAGQVVGGWFHCGWADDNGCQDPDRYASNFMSTTNGLVTLPQFQGIDVAPVATRKLNQVLCRYTAADGSERICFLRNGTITDLGAGDPTGLNDSGTVIGRDAKGKFTLRSNRKTRYASPANASSCSFNAISDDGWIVGYCAIRNGHGGFNARAVVWQPGKAPVILNSLFANGSVNLTTATGINFKHQIIANGTAPAHPGVGGFLLNP